MARTDRHDCYAITPPGVEALTARELGLLGIAPGAVELGGVPFRADSRRVARANLELRTASRVLVRLGTFHASAFHELERRALQLPWAEYVPAGGVVAFRVTSRKSKLYHQDAIAQRLAAAVARRVPGSRPAARVGGMDDQPSMKLSSTQLFVVRLFRDECTVSADASGANLHQRGYRLATAKAPLRETLAAGMRRRELVHVAGYGAQPGRAAGPDTHPRVRSRCWRDRGGHRERPASRRP